MIPSDDASDDASADAPPAPEEGVGHGRPPRSTRFRPGQSGNPRGRPKRAPGLGALVTRALAQKIQAKENDRKRTMTKLDAAVIQLVNAAAKGDQHATKFVFALLGDHESRAAPPAARHTSAGDAMIVAEIVRRLSRGAD